jgi:hypothetical protein
MDFRSRPAVAGSNRSPASLNAWNASLSGTSARRHVVPGRVSAVEDVAVVGAPVPRDDLRDAPDAVHLRLLERPRRVRHRSRYAAAMYSTVVSAPSWSGGSGRCRTYAGPSHRTRARRWPTRRVHAGSRPNGEDLRSAKRRRQDHSRPRRGGAVSCWWLQPRSVGGGPYRAQHRGGSGFMIQVTNAP